MVDADVIITSVVPDGSIPPHQFPGVFQLELILPIHVPSTQETFTFRIPFVVEPNLTPSMFVAADVVPPQEPVLCNAVPKVKDCEEENPLESSATADPLIFKSPIIVVAAGNVLFPVPLRIKFP